MAEYEGMNPEFATRLRQLVEASGGRLRIVSGARSPEEQRRLWQNKLNELGLPPDIDPDDPRAAEARRWVAPPGYSKHEVGLAADLEFADADALAWAHANAKRFGLWFPLSNEEWHVELMGSRGEANQVVASGAPRRQASVEPEFGLAEREVIAPSRLAKQEAGDPFGMLMGMLGLQGFSSGGTSTGIPTLQGLTTPAGGLGQGTEITPPAAPTAMPTTGRFYAGGLSDVERFMAAVREIESGGDYTEEGPVTKWGSAKGAYQYLDSTWDGYGGYATARDAPQHVQDERARMDMENAYARYGSWAYVAAQHYAGPDQSRWEWQETQDYIAKVMAAMARY